MVVRARRVEQRTNGRRAARDQLEWLHGRAKVKAAAWQATAEWWQAYAASSHRRMLWRTRNARTERRGGCGQGLRGRGGATRQEAGCGRRRARAAEADARHGSGGGGQRGHRAAELRATAAPTQRNGLGDSLSYVTLSVCIRKCVKVFG